MQPDASRSDEPPVGDLASPSAAVACAAGDRAQGEPRLAGEPESAETRYGHLHPLTLLSRAAGLLLLEGASLGLFFWEAFAGESLQVYVRSNKLPSGDRRISGEVVMTNVPGNLVRGNLPVGMGVRFTGHDRETERVLRPLRSGLHRRRSSCHTGGHHGHTNSFDGELCPP